MKRGFNYFLVVMSCIWMGITSADPVNALVDKEFSLGIGQTANIAERLFIKFKTVLEDSRCPDHALCVMAANGKIEFEIIDVDKQNNTVILNTEDMPREAALKEHKLVLISLNPHRIDGVKISPGNYSVALRIESKTPD